jgi:hypothetical protein
MPESHSSRRNGYDTSVRPPDGGRITQSELRLCVLNSLPTKHQNYLFTEIRKRCCDFLRHNQVRASEITAEELLSEIWQKLLGTVSVKDHDGFDLDENVSIDFQAPEKDGRVVWLIEEIGGREALVHRREDILRQRHGRNLPGLGRRIVQFDENENDPEIGCDPGENSNGLQQADARRVLLGLRQTARRQFKGDDDVSLVLTLMADIPDILDESPGDRWPIQRMIALLNDRFSPPPWNDDRVDNAKRRLRNWIKRLMEKNGFDVTDLQDLFARVARKRTTGTRVSLPQLHHPNPQSWKL